MAAKKKTPAKKKPAPKKKFTAKPAKKSAAAKKKTGSKPAGKRPAKRAPTKGKGKRPARTAKRPSPRRKVVAKKPARAQKPKAPLPEAPEALALAKLIVEVAHDKKALDVMVIDTRARSSAVGYDYLVLATGESDRQLSAIEEGVEHVLKPEGKRPASVEASADWVCATWDEGVVAHFFTADRRELMDLEELWSAAPRVAL